MLARPFAGIEFKWPVARYRWPTPAELSVVLAIISGDVVLDWLSFIHPIGHLNITPWNPNVGFSFGMVLLFGRRFLPCIVLAPLLADLLVRGGPLPLTYELAFTAAYVSVYSIILWVLASPRSLFDATLPTVRDVAVLCGVAVIGAASTAILLTSVLVALDCLDRSLALSAAIRLWIGDTIGIMVMTPLLLIIGSTGLPRFSPVADSLKFLAILASVSVVFSVPESAQFQLFYIIFLPIIWVAFGSGLPSTAVALALTQVVIVLGLELTLKDDETVIAYQVMLSVLSLTGLLAGAVVSQSRRTEASLAAHREAAAQVTRLTSMGALGAAIAHEINQPLSAIATYTEFVRDETARSNPDMGLVAKAAQKAAVQVKRAADIVKHMRDLVTSNRTASAPVDLRATIDAAVAGVAAQAQSKSVSILLDVADDVPAVVADELQIEQVVANLVRNAIDAIEIDGPRQRRVVVAARTLADEVVISVADTGRGFPSDFRIGELARFAPKRPGGMGFGLIVSRAIVEAHAGRLWIDRAHSGGKICFSLRTNS